MMDYAIYKKWFYAAALYNLIWGIMNIVFPFFYFSLINMDPPKYITIWQVVGMFVLTYAPAYYWAGKNPEKYPFFILIGLIGKILGPVGFIWSLYKGLLPIQFGLTLITNDIIWWPAFFTYLRQVIRDKEGLKNFLRDK